MATPRAPGDYLLDYYMPDADPEQRATARRNLEAFADAIVHLALLDLRAAQEAVEDASANGMVESSQSL